MVTARTLALLPSVAVPAAAASQDTPCDADLAIGLDVSSSMDEGEALLQTGGLAAARRSSRRPGAPRAWGLRIIDTPGDGPNGPFAADFSRDRLLHAPSAFVEIADGLAGYPGAIRHKLLRKLETPMANR